VSLPITYGMYALFAALSFVFVLTKVPETNGMSLDEANTLLPQKNSAKKVAVRS
jgi:SP family sugar:H+ symporter-like MFS transporter